MREGGREGGREGEGEGGRGKYSNSPGWWVGRAGRSLARVGKWLVGWGQNSKFPRAAEFPSILGAREGGEG